MADTPRDFSELVKQIVATRHGGNYYAMAKTLKVSSALPYQWRDGTVKAPSLPTLLRLCETYGLDFWHVMRVIHGEHRPVPKRRRGRGIVAGLLLALTTAGGVPVLPGTVLQVLDNMRLIGSRRRRPLCAA